MGDRVILHSDMNSFYASVEQAEHPELRGKPVAVAGNQELRHGIILTKSKEAKKYGIKTAEAIWQARKKCPELIVVPPNYRLYSHYSNLARGIYNQYTDLVEPFGLDEAWLDVTGSLHLFGGSVRLVADEISARMKAELGCTISIGVSWNKIFAKFGSDYKKPDAITMINKNNYRAIVWPSPVRDLLYVGAATERKLHSSNILTIGDLAHASDYYLDHRFGVIGHTLRSFARGEDSSPVKAFNPDFRDVMRTIKSYGNGLTAPHDIKTSHDAKALLYILAESVAQRMREDSVRCSTVAIGVRYGDDLSGYTRQVKLPSPISSTTSLAKAAWALLSANECFGFGARPIRALHVRASSLSIESSEMQLSLFDCPDDNNDRVDAAIDDLRRRFGNTIIRRGIELADESIVGLDIKGENVVHPVGYFHE